MRLLAEQQGAVQGIGRQLHVVRVLRLAGHLQVRGQVAPRLAHNVIWHTFEVVLRAVRGRALKGARGRVRLWREGRLELGLLCLLACLGLQLQRAVHEKLEEERGSQGAAELHHAAGRVGRHLNVVQHGRQPLLQGCLGQRLASECHGCSFRHHCLGRHATKRKVRLRNLPALGGGLESHAHARGDNGNIVLAPVRLLILLHILELACEGEEDALQDLMRLHVHLPVGDEELGCWDLALAGALTGHSEYGAGGHPDGVQVGDGGPGAHVAADAGGVADLGARKPVQLVDDGMACGRLVGWPCGDEVLAGVHQVG
mmetsp:Transcript_25215/g.65460  ORF Transcript_25215/g.65460 Transcript_25215/m.65460 type:complete len:314 (-) Transcript_25215:763-1704(-)